MMIHDPQKLRDVKAAAKAEFASIDGVEGVGIGDNVIRIYVRNAEVQKRLPHQYKGVDVEFVTTGGISAQSS